MPREGSRERSTGGFGAGGGGKMRKPKKRVCNFCIDKIVHIDYKDVNKIRRFVSERGKIVPRRISGNCAKHQRQVTVAIKRARNIAFLPFTTD